VSRLSTRVVRPEDTRNFTLMLAELRRQLDALGRANHRHYLLTAAVPAGFDKIAKLSTTWSTPTCGAARPAARS
jgi:GH18 family chitinase